MRKTLAAAGLTAGLAVGAAAGFTFTSGAASVGAQDSAGTTTVTAPEGRSAERGSRLREVLQPLVDDGTIDGEQADKVVETLLAARPGDGDHESGPGRGRGSMPGLAAAATALGVTEDELAEQLRSGSTIEEIAEERDVELSVVVDALVAEATERLDAAVEDGRLTQEEADARAEKITERVTAFVDGERPEGGPGHRGGRPGR